MRRGRCRFGKRSTELAWSRSRGEAGAFSTPLQKHRFEDEDDDEGRGRLALQPLHNRNFLLLVDRIGDSLNNLRVLQPFVEAWLG
jgi:hypothetical protein